MDEILAALGALFVIFLVLSAAVELVLEAFRGILEAFGFKILKGKVSLEDALKLTGEFANGNTALQAKAEAIKTVANQLGSSAKVVTAEDLEKIKTRLDAIKGNLKGTELDDAAAAAEMSGMAATVKSAVDDVEGRRVLILRFLSVLIGCVITAMSGIQILDVIRSSMGGSSATTGLGLLNSPTVNIIIGGLAASVGSSFWHDQLDRVRKAKDVSRQLTAVVKQQ